MPSPTKTITVTQTWVLTESLINTFLELNPKEKLVLDGEGNPTYAEGSMGPVMETMTQEETMAHISKYEMALPVVSDTTAKCEALYGKLNYNAQEMNDYIMNNLTVSVVIE